MLESSKESEVPKKDRKHIICTLHKKGRIIKKFLFPDRSFALQNI